MPPPATPLLARLTRATPVLLLLFLSSCGTPEEKAQDHYRRGTELIAKNDLARARLEFRNAVQLKDDFVPAWRSIAKLEEQQQNWPAANAALRQIARLDQKDTDARLQLSSMALFSGRFQEALEWVDAAVAIDGTNARTLALRAAALFKIGDEAAAVREARRSLELAPGNKEAATVLAAERFARDDTDGALRLLDTIGGDAASDLGVELFRIKIYAKRNELDQVEQRLRKLVERYPKEPVLNTQLLQFYLSHNRLDDSERLLRQGADSDASNSTAALALVRFLKEARGEAAARRELEERLKRAADPFPYQFAIAELDIATGRAEAAEAQLKTLIADGKARERTEAAQLRLAQHYITTKRFALADPVIADVLKSDAGNGQARRLRATSLLEQGLLEEAIGQLREALGDQPRSTDLMLLLAVAYERSGSIELAAKQYANAARNSNLAPAPTLDYVAFLLRRGRSEEAEDVLGELTSRNPDNVDALSAQAQLRLSRRNWAGARDTAEAIRRLGNKPGLADQIIGAASAGQRNYEHSVTALTQAYNTNPGEAGLMFALVRSYVLAKQPEKADAFLDSILAKDASNAEARVLKGLLQMASNQPGDAAQSFKAAIEANRKSPMGYRALADLRIKQKSYDDALSVLQAGLREEPTSSPLQLAYAEALEIKGDYEGAIATYERMLGNEPGSLIVANNLSSLLAEHRVDEASLDRATKLAKGLARSEVPQFKDTLGWISARRGDYKTALPLLESAAAALPSNAAVRYHLAMAYLKAGEPAKGSVELRKAAELIGDEDKALAVKIAAALRE
ncbi:MAG: tetratricopeptide repeat protein [Bradyrhizobium sp.]|nr:tetratricopeptide repeat protein [Bradyrhizobium sp.]